MTDYKLQKVLADAGCGSRREMERAIEAGQVTVNGKAAHIGERVKEGDKLQCRGKMIVVPKASEQTIRVLVYNKPEGQICSRNDPEGRPTVFDSLPSLQEGRWVSIGRLDFNTSGLLLFSNNGELANKLMHPSTGIDREYTVRVLGDVNDEMLQRFRDGIMLDDGMARFSDVVPAKEMGTQSNAWYYCTVMEGRNREVRRLWESQDVRVSRLKRVRYGPIFLPSFLKPGQWLELGDKELGDLYSVVGMRKPKLKKTSAQKQVIERRTKRLRAGGGKTGTKKVKPKVRR